ncbi:MAG: hypothetical protein RLZZ360_807 [Candidatus Parcubacteria bacterium]|jgi:antitoxin component of RelBE/YafQ-DinJ toxin-antitoxin module
MKTVLSIKTDKDIKDRAQALAKHLRIPLSLVVNAQLKAFVESGEFTISREPELKPAVIKALNKAAQEVQTKKKLSPRFNTASEAIDWLNS